MKLLKLIILTILLLFNCFINCSASNNIDCSSTGKLDSVKVSILDIRKCNEKLIERKYYIKISEEQDSLICLKDEYIKQQYNVIDALQNRILEVNKINENLIKDYKREQKKNVIIGSVGGVIIVGVVTGLVINCLK